MELTRGLEQAKKRTAIMMASWNGGIFTSSSTLTSGFCLRRVRWAFVCTAIIASRSDGGARPLCSWDRGGNSGFDKVCSTLPLWQQ
jgi:hypothetical protein